MGFKNWSLTALSLSALLLSGCSGEGQGVPVTGVYADGAIGNAEYRCGSKVGITEANGEFTCFQGDEISFHIGSIKLGSVNSVPSDGFVLIQDSLGKNRNDVNDPEVTLMAQFLQSVDIDANHNNGIFIDASLLIKKITEATELRKLNAQQVNNIVASVGKTMVSPSVAKQNLQATTDAIINTGELPETSSSSSSSSSTTSSSTLATNSSSSTISSPTPSDTTIATFNGLYDGSTRVDNNDTNLTELSTYTLTLSFDENMSSAGFSASSSLGATLSSVSVNENNISFSYLADGSQVTSGYKVDSLTINAKDSAGNLGIYTSQVILNDKSEIARLVSSDIEASDYFSRPSINGDYIVVGAPNEDTGGSNAGSAYIFKRGSDSNISQIAKIQASDAQASDEFGFSTSISGDYILVGAPNEDTGGSNAGATYVFKRASDTSISQIAKLTASDAEAGDKFGESVSISGDYIIIGARYEDTTATDSGAVYVFKRGSDSNISQIAKLQASNANSSDNFGGSLEIDGDYIVIGASNQDTTASNSGAAYVFKRGSDSNISEIGILKANNAGSNDNFGFSTSISGDYLIVGSYREDTNALNAGSAYVFKRDSDSNISQIAQLQSSDIEQEDYFGVSVGISGDHMIVGAHAEDTTASSAGSAYLFKRNSDVNISQVKKYQASDAKANDIFGIKTAIDGRYFLSGIYESSGQSKGAVFVNKF